MKRFNRIAAEILAIAALWILWDFRVAATLFVLLVVVRALQEDRPGRARRDAGDVPTLTQTAGAASPGDRQRP